MARLLLDNVMVEEDFFSDSHLIAIGSVLPGYALCWWLNQCFNLQFTREPELDICIQQDKHVPGRYGDLFTKFGESSVDTMAYYPVFRHELPNYEAALFLYHNRCAAERLLPEMKHADYLLLIQNTGYLEAEKKLLIDLNKVAGINWTKELDLKIVKSRKRLIL